MAASLEEEDDILKNDYYALLNVGKDVRALTYSGLNEI